MKPEIHHSCPTPTLQIDLKICPSVPSYSFTIVSIWSPTPQESVTRGGEEEEHARHQGHIEVKRGQHGEGASWKLLRNRPWCSPCRYHFRYQFRRGQGHSPFLWPKRQTLPMEIWGWVEESNEVKDCYIPGSYISFHLLPNTLFNSGSFEALTPKQAKKQEGNSGSAN